MTAYFVDTENVHSHWKQVCAAASEGDEFFLFYSPESPAVSMDIFGDASLRGVGFRFIPCVPGDNAMDFQLCTELGRQIGSGWDGDVIILSGDKGFDCVVKYWLKQGVRIDRRDCVPRQPSVKSLFVGFGLTKKQCLDLDEFVAAARKRDGSPAERVSYVRCRVGGAYQGETGKEIWSRVHKIVEAELLCEFDNKPAVCETEKPVDVSLPDVRQIYADGLRGLSDVSLSDERLQGCVNILVHSMRQPENRRMGIICSQFRSHLGDVLGRKAYNGVKPLVLEWGQNGVIPAG